MAKCRRKGCEKEALFKSEFCWDHIEDREDYKRRILRPHKDGRTNLRGANLEGTVLWGTYLWGADLIKAGLKGAYLEGANLGGADLRGANLEETDLRGAYLGGANLQGANLKDADLRGANLRGADLRKAELREAYLKEANLKEVNLGGADLRGANLVVAKLDGAKLVRARLEGANLDGDRLEGANLGGADLRGAKLERTNLGRTNLKAANLSGAKLGIANLEEANVEEANLVLSNLIGAYLYKANLTNADLRHANLNEADLTKATLTGAKVWGMSHAGCKTDGIRAEYLNFDRDGKDSGIVHLDKQQAEEFFSSPPTIEILLQNELSTSAIRLLTDLIDKINERNPDWDVKPKRIASSSFSSELTLKASRDEILEEVANAILLAFKKGYRQKLLEYLPDRKAAGRYDLILRELGEIKNKIDNPVERVTIIHGTGEIPVNISFKESQVEVNVFGNVTKMVNVEGNYYEVSASQGRDDLITNLIDQLDSPEIEKRIEEAEVQLKSLSTEQVKFLEEQFKQSVERIFKKKQKEVGFFDRLKAFSQRVSESVFTGVIGKAIWYLVEKFGLPG
jgi:uncharacterized protein YjbI with pentapeptide repeats